MSNRKPRRKSESTAIVHLSAADLTFRAVVERQLLKLSTTAREMPRTFQTPEFQGEVIFALDTAVADFIERMPSVGEENGIERRWEFSVAWQEDKYVMIRSAA